jgi:arylsulfatase A-like enzyme
VKALFLDLDTLRRDYLEPCGTSWVKTPNIARLAERSVVCDSHLVGSLPCMPARREMMTARATPLASGLGAFPVTVYGRLAATSSPAVARHRTPSSRARVFVPRPLQAAARIPYKGPG